MLCLSVNNIYSMLSSSNSTATKTTVTLHKAECPCVCCLNRSLRSLSSIRLQLVTVINQRTQNREGLNISAPSWEQQATVHSLIEEIETLDKNLKPFKKDFSPKQIKKMKKKENRQILKDETLAFETKNGANPEHDKEEFGYLKNPETLKLAYLGGDILSPEF